MINTNTAIATLEALLGTINSQIKGLTSQSDSLNIALNQLKGILIVQATELENKYRTQIDELMVSNVNLQTTIDTKQTTNVPISTATDIPII